MKALQVLLLLFIVAVSIGCGAMGEKRRSGDQITVVIAPSILERPEKVEEILENQGVEHLYNYLQNYIRDGGGLRDSIKVHVTISQLRVGWGRDMMGVDVYVAEKGEELKVVIPKKSLFDSILLRIMLSHLRTGLVVILVH